MAEGIDAIAHQTAVEQKGKTIAILGSGFYHLYPPENEWLFHKLLANGGCLLTEYAPNTEIDKKNFPKRNRLISALSDEVLVVEAAYRSGTSITVKYAKEMGKKIYAVPSNIDSSKGVGTNRFIREGAILVVTPQDILEGKKNQNIRREDRRETIQETKIKDIPKEYTSIYNLLTDKPLHVNEITKKLHKSIQEITSTLTIMELEGYVLQIQNNSFIKLRKEE